MLLRPREAGVGTAPSRGHCGEAYIGMSARGNDGRYHDYACTARRKYGPKACQGERLPRAKLEQAVQYQLADIYRDGICATYEKVGVF